VPDPGLDRQVRAALAALPEAQREAVVLHRFEGLSFAEIAEAAGVTESAVKVRAHRGYEALRAALRGVWEP
jgi:RNA polymerase sigma-70 factor (ECF subfamily)